MGKHKMIAKICPKCELQSLHRMHCVNGCLLVQLVHRVPCINNRLHSAHDGSSEKVAVASKTCKCGHTFFAARRGADCAPAVEDIRRRTGRVRRNQPQFYDAQHYQKQIKKRSPKKRSLSRSMDDEIKPKEKSDSARARRRRALRRAQRPPPTNSGERTRDPTPQLRPPQLARCRLILQEINRKISAVKWQPPNL